MSETTEKIARFQTRARTLREEIGKVIVGQDEMVDLVLLCLFAGGHALIEGLPGLGKTAFVRTLSQVLDLEFARIQFTPDLMPADVTGTNVIVESEGGRRDYSFRRGPIFANLVLADEINRATPKTQSALLQAMQESEVTVWGVTHAIERPLFVLATQNPIEMEGTYPLPEAQLDRFLFKVDVRRAGRDELIEIVNRTTRREEVRPNVVMRRDELLESQAFVREVIIAPHVVDFAARLVTATHADAPDAPERVKTYVRFGASPRACQSMTLAAKVLALQDGRMNVSYSDLRRVAKPALRHRLVLGYQAQMDGVSADDLVEDLLQAVPESADVRGAR